MKPKISAMNREKRSMTGNRSAMNSHKNTYDTRNEYYEQRKALDDR